MKNSSITFRLNAKIRLIALSKPSISIGGS